MTTSAAAYAIRAGRGMSTRRARNPKAAALPAAPSASNTRTNASRCPSRVAVATGASMLVSPDDCDATQTASAGEGATASVAVMSRRRCGSRSHRCREPDRQRYPGTA